MRFLYYLYFTNMQAEEKQAFYKMLGERIRGARITAGLKQDALAGQLNLSRVSIVNIEKGRQHPPLHLLWDMARLLDVELVKLIPEFESRSPTPEKWKKLIEKQPINDENTHKRLLEFIEGIKST